MHNVAIYWLRRDLRLADNPALRYACAHAKHIVFAYIHAPDEETPWQPGAASRWWLHHSLTALARKIEHCGNTLVIRSGASLATLRGLIDASGATLVVWNRLYEPAIIERDKHIKAALQTDGREVHSCNAALLFEPWQIKTQQAQAYKVFTPFWRTCAAQLDTLTAPQPAPKKVTALTTPQSSLAVADLALLPTIRWDAGFTQHWQPGEAGAHRALEKFIDHACVGYKTARDIPSLAGTSHLAPHLHFGEIGPRQVLAALHAHGDSAIFTAGRDAFVREIGWREFAHHVLYHFPHTTNEPFDARFANYPWEQSAAQVRAWQRGRTGFPIIDAGMRELWHTGYMHNRVRMLVASLLTKNLRIHWLEGARWFWDTLVDADLANNSLGWQWTAGCGTDAAPYFRIFSPVLQSERFDPQGIYLRRWLPELAALPDKWIHQPWTAPAAILEKAGVRLGDNYPTPIVDLKASRDDALTGYQSLRTPI
jgi:deoxyribodipyrimidine photo-lyase